MQPCFPYGTITKNVLDKFGIAKPQGFSCLLIYKTRLKWQMSVSRLNFVEAPHPNNHVHAQPSTASNIQKSDYSPQFEVIIRDEMLLMSPN